MFIYQAMRPEAGGAVQEKSFRLMLESVGDPSFEKGWKNALSGLTAEQYARLGESLAGHSAAYEDRGRRERSLLRAAGYIEKALYLSGGASQDGKIEKLLGDTYNRLGEFYASPETRINDAFKSSDDPASYEQVAKEYNYPAGIGFFQKAAAQYGIAYRKEEMQPFPDPFGLCSSKMAIADNFSSLGSAQLASGDLKGAGASYGKALEDCKMAKGLFSGWKRAEGQGQESAGDKEKELSEMEKSIRQKIAAAGK